MSDEFGNEINNFLHDSLKKIDRKIGSIIYKIYEFFENRAMYHSLRHVSTKNEIADRIRIFEANIILDEHGKSYKEEHQTDKE